MSSVQIEPENLPDAGPANHGRTTAAWVTNIGLTVAALVAAFGIMIPNHVLSFTGLGLAVLSLVAGGVLRALGHGQLIR